MQMTKPARRLYVGGVPPSMGEVEITRYFNDTIKRAVYPVHLDSDPVLSVYINKEKCFAFVEVSTIELATACSQLDGVTCNMVNPPATLRIRRPNDYRPDQVPANLPPPPMFNLAALGIVSTTVADGPNKVFVGGLPYNLSEEHVKELLSAFGSLKSFHLVKDAGASSSKGYGFCEYSDTNNMHAAVVGLNGMAIGDKSLTVRLNDRVPQPPGPRPPTLPPPPLNPLATQPPTKVLLLKNIITKEELQNDSEFEDVQEDVKDECSTYGVVEAVILPRGKDGFSAAAEGSVYVKYATAEMARTAALALSGRKFAERTVVVEYVSEVLY
jgi:splicing factor U2AF subunit